MIFSSGWLDWTLEFFTLIGELSRVLGMAENFFTSRSERGKTFTIVMWVIGLGFTVQVMLAASAFLLRTPPKLTLENPPLAYSPPQNGLVGEFASPGTEESTNPTQENAGQGVNGESLVNDGTEGGVSVDGSPPSSAGETETSPNPVNLLELNMALAEARKTAPPIPDVILARLVDTGEELRNSGNMQGALQALAKAEAAVPDHPRILSQMAATYTEMGVNQAASEYWAEVVALGSAASGPYFEIAKRVRAGQPLLGRESNTVSSPAGAESAKGSVLKIGEIKVNEQPPGESGQRVSLRIVVDSLDGAGHAGEDLSLFVFFYDLVNGDQIRDSTADTSYLYPTEPYDWKVNGREEFIVNYNQPSFSPEEIVELGQRKYYGYAIQLYYRDVLQDTVVMPTEISSLRLETPAIAAPPERLPGGANPERVGPENALFPQTPDF